MHIIESKIKFMKDIILNQVAIWRACGSTEINKRLSPKGTRYLAQGNSVYQTSEDCLIRYAKDYDKNGVKFCLFVRTDVDNDSLAERALDQFAKKCTKEYILSVISNSRIDAVEYTPFFYDPNSLKQEIK